MGCHCPPGLPIHFVHQESIREFADLVLDHGMLFENPYRPQIPLQYVERIAPMIPKAAVIYVFPDIFPTFVNLLLPKLENPIVLVTHGSDWDMTLEYPHLLDHPMIHHWFTQNGETPQPHPKLSQLPIGINNPVYTDLERRVGSFGDQLLGKTAFDLTGRINRAGDQVKFNAAVAENKGLAGKKPLRVLASYTVNRYHGVRAEATRVLRRSDCTTFLNEFLSPERYWMLHKDFAFEASPAGNGLDCYRTWEALALRTIPIVRTSPLDRLYRDHGFPVAIVESWEEITPSRLVEWNEMLSPMLEECQPRLTSSYWETVVRKKAQELS